MTQLTSEEILGIIRATSENRIVRNGEIGKAIIRNQRNGAEVCAIKIPDYYLIIDRVVLISLSYLGPNFYKVDDYMAKETISFAGARGSISTPDFSKFAKLVSRDLKTREYRRLFSRIISWITTLANENKGFYTNHDFLSKFIAQCYGLNIDPRDISLQRADDFYYQLQSNSLAVWEPFCTDEESSKRLFTESCCRILLDFLPIQELRMFVEKHPDLISTGDLATKLEELIANRQVNDAEFFFETLNRLEPSCPILTSARRSIDTLVKLSFLRENYDLDLEEINSLTGMEFESLLASKFETLGYSVEMTPTTGDYGADLIITTPNESRIAVQCKRFKTKVNLKAVQEVVASLSHYSCDFGVVITNNEFLKSAENLAKKNDVELWEKNRLVSFLSGDLTFSEIQNL